jgi:lysophospholipase L1-like esterase
MIKYRRSLLPITLILLLAAAANDPITIYLAGDSTMAAKLESKRPETGWGEALQNYFDDEVVRISNHARNGRSTRTFIEERLWQAIVDGLKPGDYVFIQFGHNDQSKDKVDRYTPPDDYRRNLSRFVNDVRSKQAHPVLLTPVRRRRFDRNAKLYDTHGEYPDIVRAVAAEQRVPLIDMHAGSAELLTLFGAEASRQLFLQLKAGEHANYPAGVEDNTHFSPLGAKLMAHLVVDGIRELRLPVGEKLRKN